MEASSGSALMALGGAGIVAGLYLLWRGFGSYRSLIRVGDTSTSSISSVAAGEVRITGLVEPGALTLVSPLQSVPCVFYRSTIRDAEDGLERTSGFAEERSIGFSVRDATGALRVFPRDARIDAPVRFEDETDFTGDEPTGLDIRTGSSTRATETDPIDAAAALLTAAPTPDWRARLVAAHGRRVYREERLEPGDRVTIVGRALPFSDLSDPAGSDLGGSDLGGGVGLAADDPEVAADIAAGRASGTLALDAATAWGNAAIPGFGIGRPRSTPLLDPDADTLALAPAIDAVDADRAFRIAPTTLVLAASDEVPLLIASGTPGAVLARGRETWIVGLLGGVLAIASAMGFAVGVTGGLGR